ncbi:hypothetical protein PAPYR_5338 [Paratrimastix pyriformis]|uniref:UNC93-like protein MFSD11 n=1 Tax=Paratrimastix pyriformis TaxID=342808 RepID=A0ABQ8UHV2_9EUKA|nr:hypothetical protein PAPYR_5338 [Paratrimastix pyriformis]
MRTRIGFADDFDYYQFSASSRVFRHVQSIGNGGLDMRLSRTSLKFLLGFFEHDGVGHLHRVRAYCPWAPRPLLSADLPRATPVISSVSSRIFKSLHAGSHSALQQLFLSLITGSFAEQRPDDGILFLIHFATRLWQLGMDSGFHPQLLGAANALALEWCLQLLDKPQGPCTRTVAPGALKPVVSLVRGILSTKPAIGWSPRQSSPHDGGASVDGMALTVVEAFLRSRRCPLAPYRSLATVQSPRDASQWGFLPTAVFSHPTVVRVVGPPLSQSRVVEGLLLDTPLPLLLEMRPASPVPRPPEPGLERRAILVEGALGPMGWDEEDEGMRRVIVEGPDAAVQLGLEERHREWAGALLWWLQQGGVEVVFAQKRIHESIQNVLGASGILAVERVGVRYLLPLARLLGAAPLSAARIPSLVEQARRERVNASPWDPGSPHLGWVGGVAVVAPSQSTQRFLYVAPVGDLASRIVTRYQALLASPWARGSPPSPMQTIPQVSLMLCAPTANRLDELAAAVAQCWTVLGQQHGHAQALREQQLRAQPQMPGPGLSWAREVSFGEVSLRLVAGAGAMEWCMAAWVRLKVKEVDLSQIPACAYQGPSARIRFRQAVELFCQALEAPAEALVRSCGPLAASWLPAGHRPPFGDSGSLTALCLAHLKEQAIRCVTDEGSCIGYDCLRRMPVDVFSAQPQLGDSYQSRRVGLCRAVEMAAVLSRVEGVLAPVASPSQTESDSIGAVRMENELEVVARVITQAHSYLTTATSATQKSRQHCLLLEQTSVRFGQAREALQQLLGYISQHLEELSTRSQAFGASYDELQDISQGFSSDLATVFQQLRAQPLHASLQVAPDGGPAAQPISAPPQCLFDFVDSESANALEASIRAHITELHPLVEQATALRSTAQPTFDDLSCRLAALPQAESASLDGRTRYSRQLAEISSITALINQMSDLQDRVVAFSRFPCIWRPLTSARPVGSHGAEIEHEMEQLPQVLQRIFESLQTVLGEAKTIEASLGLQHEGAETGTALGRELEQFDALCTAHLNASLPPLEDAFLRAREQILGQLQEMHNIVVWYDLFLSAYEGLLQELQRRQAVQEERARYVNEVRARLAALHHEEVMKRLEAAEVHGPYLPDSLRRPFDEPPPYYDVVALVRQPTGATSPGGGLAAAAQELSPPGTTASSPTLTMPSVMGAVASPPLPVEPPPQQLPSSPPSPVVVHSVLVPGAPLFQQLPLPLPLPAPPATCASTSGLPTAKQQPRPAAAPSLPSPSIRLAMPPLPPLPPPPASLVRMQRALPLQPPQDATPAPASVVTTPLPSPGGEAATPAASPALAQAAASPHPAAPPATPAPERPSPLQTDSERLASHPQPLPVLPPLPGRPRSSSVGAPPRADPLAGPPPSTSPQPPAVLSAPAEPEREAAGEREAEKEPPMHFPHATWAPGPTTERRPVSTLVEVLRPRPAEAAAVTAPQPIAAPVAALGAALSAAIGVEPPPAPVMTPPTNAAADGLNRSALAAAAGPLTAAAPPLLRAASASASSTSSTEDGDLPPELAAPPMGDLEATALFPSAAKEPAGPPQGSGASAAARQASMGSLRDVAGTAAAAAAASGGPRGSEEPRDGPLSDESTTSRGGGVIGSSVLSPAPVLPAPPTGPALLPPAKVSYDSPLTLFGVMSGGPPRVAAPTAPTAPTASTASTAPTATAAPDPNSTSSATTSSSSSESSLPTQIGEPGLAAGSAAAPAAATTGSAGGPSTTTSNPSPASSSYIDAAIFAPTPPMPAPLPPALQNPPAQAAAPRPAAALRYSLFLSGYPLPPNILNNAPAPPGEKQTSPPGAGSPAISPPPPGDGANSLPRGMISPSPTMPLSPLFQGRPRHWGVTRSPSSLARATGSPSPPLTYGRAPPALFRRAPGGAAGASKEVEGGSCSPPSAPVPAPPVVEAALRHTSSAQRLNALRSGGGPAASSPYVPAAPPPHVSPAVVQTQPGTSSGEGISLIPTTSSKVAAFGGKDRSSSSLRPRQTVPGEMRVPPIAKCVWLGIGFLLSYSAEYATENLMTTIYGSFGFMSMSYAYFVVAVSALWSPHLTELVGPRLSIFLGSLPFLFFSVASIFKEQYLVLPSSILLGLGASIIWCGQGKYLYAICPDPARLGLYTGTFFFCFAASGVVGNLLMTIIRGQLKNDQLSFIVLSAIGGVGCLAFALLPRPPPRPPAPRRGAERITPSPLQALQVPLTGGASPPSTPRGGDTPTETATSPPKGSPADAARPSCCRRVGSFLGKTFLPVVRIIFTPSYLLLLPTFLAVGLIPPYWSGVYPPYAPIEHVSTLFLGPPLAYPRPRPCRSASRQHTLTTPDTPCMWVAERGAVYVLMSPILGRLSDCTGRLSVTTLMHAVGIGGSVLGHLAIGAAGTTQLVLFYSAFALFGLYEACFGTQLFAIIGFLTPDQAEVGVAAYSFLRSVTSGAFFMGGAASLAPLTYLIVFVAVSVVAVVCLFVLHYAVHALDIKSHRRRHPDESLPQEELVVVPARV